MNGLKAGLLIAAAVGAYATFLVVMITFAVRWSRRVLTRKSEALHAGFDSVGGKKVAEAMGTGGLYTGHEVEYDVGGQRVFTNAYYVSRSFVRVNLRIPSGPYPWTVIHPEGKVERIGKALGVNREVQTGDKAFDDAAYVDTIDTDEHVSRLLASPEVREALKELLSLGYRAQFSARGVEAFQIVYALTPVDGLQAGRAAAALGRIAGAAPKFVGEALKPMRLSARGFAVALMLVPLFLGLMIAGGTSFFSARTVAHGDVLFAFLVGGGALWAAYVAALASYLRGRSYAMRLLLVGAFVAMFGVVAAGGGILLTLNQLLDGGVAVVHPQAVLSKHQYKRERSVNLASWRAGEDHERLRVTQAEFDVLTPGSMIEVRVRPGAFGWQWVEGHSTPAALANPGAAP